MAFVPQPVWSISFTFKDNNDNFASTGIDLPASLPFADASSFASGLGAAMASLSDAYLTRIYITLQLNNDATENIPASAEVERKLALTFDAGSFKSAFRMEIPSPVFALEQPRTDAADPDNLALTGFIDYMLNGNLGAGNGPRTYYGSDLTALAKAVIVHRSRKPRA